MKLYDIPFEIAGFELDLENSGGVTEELERRWQDFVASGKDKIEAAAMVVRTLEAQAEACASEAKRLKERAESLDKNADRLKHLMIAAVDSLGGKVKTPLFTIWTQDSKATRSVDLADGTDMAEMEEYLPEFVRTVRELNKKAILEKLDSGEWEPPECLVITNKPGTHYLRIR